MIKNKYAILDFIGKGKFGEVFKGIHTLTDEYVAIKIEKNNSVKLLKHETTILNYLYRKECKNIPIIYWYGIHLSFPTLVMTYYHQILREDNFSEFHFSSIISILEKIHECQVIHRDIKPSNFLLDKNNEIHLIDFGFATFYMDDTWKHKSNSFKEYIIGTPTYISIYIHNGNEPSRRDDLISLGYIYLYLNQNIENPLLMGKINLANDGNNQYDSELHINHPLMSEKRERKKWENLSNKISSSLKIFEYLNYCYSLNYDEKPNYKKLKELFM